MFSCIHRDLIRYQQPASTIFIQRYPIGALQRNHAAPVTQSARSYSKSATPSIVRKRTISKASTGGRHWPKTTVGNRLPGPMFSERAVAKPAAAWGTQPSFGRQHEYVRFAKPFNPRPFTFSRQKDIFTPPNDPPSIKILSGKCASSTSNFGNELCDLTSRTAG